MDFKQSIRVIRRHWLPILITIAAGLAAALIYLAVAPPQYTTQTKLLLAPSGGTGTAQEHVQGNNLVVQQVGTFSQLAVTPVVLQPVIDELNLDTTPAELAEFVVVAPVPQSALIAIETTADTADGAVDLGNSVAASLSSQIQSSTNPDQSPVVITATVVQEPVAPALPSSPNPILSILVGLAAGLAVAFIIVVLAEVLNTRTRNGRDLARATDAPYLGRVPRSRAVSRKPVIALASPSGRVAEAVRIIRSKLVASLSGTPAPVIVVGSPHARDGKSVIAANLAVVLAESGLRVTLIDANLRSPSLAKAFGLHHATGFSDALQGNESAATVERATVTPGLTVVTTAPVATGAGDLLSSPRARAAVEGLRQGADIVVIDAGSLVSVSDAVALANVASGYVVVSRAGRTRIDDLHEAVSSLEAAGAAVYGVILNGAPLHGADARD